MAHDLKMPLEDPIYDDAPNLPTRRWREAGFDIETSNLKADIGIVIAACVKPVGEAPIVFRLDDPKYKKRQPWDDETALIEDILDCLSDCTRIFGWYSKNFDVKFLRSRRILCGIKDPITTRHADLWAVARLNLLFHNNRLDTMMDAFSRHKKTGLFLKPWRMAAAGHKPSIQKVVDHCIEDVCGLEDVYLHLEPYVQHWTPVII